MGKESGRSSNDRNIAIIIAHGVGEADPGYPTTALANALAKSGAFHCDDDARIRQLRDANAPKEEREATFPVFISHGRLVTGQRLTFAELYWADLTKIGTHRVDAILGFFRIIFESHHFIDAMLERHRGAGPKILRQLLLVASWMLRGPIIGLVITISAIFWAALYVRPTFWLYELGATALFGGTSALVFVISAAVLLWAVRRGDETWYDPTAWTALSSFIVAAIFFGLWCFDVNLGNGCSDVHGQPPYCRQAYIDAIYGPLKTLWRLWGVIIVVAFIVAVWVWLRRKVWAGAPPVLTALGVVLLQFVLWTAILGTAIMPVVYRAEEIRGINALKAHVEKDPPFSASLSTLTSQEPAVGRLLDVVPWDPNGSSWINRVSLGYGFNGLMIVCIILIAFFTYVARQLIARRLLAGRTAVFHKMPRMLVGRWILTVLLIVTFFQALYLAGGMDVQELAELLNVPLLADAFSRWRRGLLAVGWITALVLPWLLSLQLGNFVHIARDLIDHQYSRRRASALARRSRDREDWPRRARIQARLMTLLDAVVGKGRFDQVVFLVHSQGSVIAFDYLKEAAPENRALGGLKPDIVTVGSPLAHLYEHYFYEYIGLEKDISALRSNIGRWINLYRIDDYVGAGIADRPETGIRNEVIGLGGHMDYWKEDRLASVIVELATTVSPPALVPTNGTR